MVPFHLLLATHDAVRVQDGDPCERVRRRPHRGQYALHGAQALFADPLHPPASASKLVTTGVNRDTLLTVGWLDLSKGPQILHVPDMAGRYYSVQFTDPSNNTNFAYVGKRTTGTEVGDYLITGPHWKGALPNGMAQIPSPNHSVLLIGRVFVEGDGDLSTAHGLAKQIQVAPLTVRQPSQ